MVSSSRWPWRVIYCTIKIAWLLGSPECWSLLSHGGWQTLYRVYLEAPEVGEWRLSWLLLAMFKNACLVWIPIKCPFDFPIPLFPNVLAAWAIAIFLVLLHVSLLDNQSLFVPRTRPIAHAKPKIRPDLGAIPHSAVAVHI